MGVIIKYLADFQDLGLKVSNDITQGDFTLDASITVSMNRGADGCSFNIQLFDLPQAKADTLALLPSIPAGGSDTKSALNELGKRVTISLGYFDTLAQLETAAHALKQTRYASTFSPPSISVDAAIQQLLNDAKKKGIKGGEFTTPALVKLPPAPDSKHSKVAILTPHGPHLMDGLNDLATGAKAEMLVCDKQIRIGKPIVDDDYSPDKFVPGINLGKFEPFKKTIPDQTDPTVSVLLKSTTAEGFNFAVVGDPKLRPAQKVSVGLDSFEPNGEYRIQSVKHVFNTTGGYTCEGVATKVISDDNAKRREEHTKKATADTIVEGLGQVASAHRKQSPSIEVGQVKSYTAGASGAASDPTAPKKNNADVYYGQVYETEEKQPSIHAAVQNDDSQVLKDKPMVSPFAWHKCGLVVPVYPGMKAVLSHNLSLQDDAMVTGFIWSDHPAFDAPANKKGDWWLSLPVFTSDSDPPIPPPDDTKITNDLTAMSGLRVIEVSGLKITVGKMQTLGTRPTEGAADEFLIEHKKAKIHIAADGSMEIVADADGGKGKITIASGGDISMTATGGVTMKVGGSAVEIS